MKRLLLLAAMTMCAGSAAVSQDLAYKIPENVWTVASLKSEQLFQLSSVTEFDQSSWGEKILKELSDKYDHEYKSISEMGVNLSANIYYYYQFTDSIKYNGILIPLSDAKKIDSLFGNANDVMIGNGFKYQLANHRSMVSWNDQFLFILTGNQQYQFFEDSTVCARYGLPFQAKRKYYDDVSADTAVAYDAPGMDATDTLLSPMIDSAVIAIDSIASAQSILSQEEDELDLNTRSIEEIEVLKDSLSRRWLLAYTQQIFDKKEGSPSILNNPSYQHGMDKNALATCWVADLQTIYTSLLPYALMRYGSMIKGYGNFSSKLYMDNSHIRITGEMGLDKDKADFVRAIMDHRLNKKFLQYINCDSLIGFMSYAINTEAYLKNMPSLFRGFTGKYDEEMEMMLEFVSLLLDEKAVSKVVKGDALFILSGIHEREVSYKSYGYDEESFQYKDTMMTKKETMPDFLCMFSSDDTRIIEHLLAYGTKGGFITYNDGIYSISKVYKSSFVMHMVIKDGIVFLGSSIDEISSIQHGTFKAAVNKEQKELLLKNNMSMFFNPRNLGNKLPERELGEIVLSLKELLGGAGNVYMKTNGIHNGYISAELTADVPADKGNALKYFIDMMNQLSKLK